MHPFNDLVVPENSVGIQWFGQSTFGLKHPDGTLIQVDPYYPHERPSETFVHGLPPLDESTLRTDYVLLTHDHGDHTCIESLERIHAAYPEVKFIGPPEIVSIMISSPLSIVTAGEREASKNPQWQVEADSFKVFTVIVIYPFSTAGKV